MQRGIGLYATCERCNTFSGATYVPAYLDFVAAVGRGSRTGQTGPRRQARHSHPSTST